MLFPRESESRDVKLLDGIWQFKCDEKGEGHKKKWFKGLKGTMPMAVPASYNDLTQDRFLRDHVGEVWYERDFWVPRDWEGRRIMLRVGAASHRSVMWVNGKEVTRFKGGFLPFEADVSDVVNVGVSNRVTLAVDNTLDLTTLPPGQVKNMKDSSVGPYDYQDYQHDFFNYSGIHRPVRLYCTPKTYIDDITVVTDVRGKAGIVNYEVKIVGGRRKVKVTLRDESGKVVAEGAGDKGSLRVANARLWQPGNAYLYELQVETEGDDADVYRLSVGIRTVKVQGRRFLINGKPFYFKGFGKHEDMDIKGKGLDHAMLIKDFNLLKWCGANSFRTSHYPYAEEVLDLADREGIVIIDEAPAVGMYIFKGKQDVWTREVLKPMLEHHLEVMDQLVERDKNHPSVVMWSVANEAATQEKAFGPYFKKVFDRTRKNDPQDRPVTIVVHTWFDNDVAVKYADIIGLNRYWGWYGNAGHLDIVQTKAKWEMSNWWKHQKKPMILTEFGADTIAGMHQDPPVIFTEEFQVDYLKRICETLDKLPFIIGEHVWNFADFMTKQGISRVIGNRKGAFTRQRQPKMSAHYLRERWLKMDK